MHRSEIFLKSKCFYTCTRFHLMRSFLPRIFFVSLALTVCLARIRLVSTIPIFVARRVGDTRWRAPSFSSALVFNIDRMQSLFIIPQDVLLLLVGSAVSPGGACSSSLSLSLFHKLSLWLSDELEPHPHQHHHFLIFWSNWRHRWFGDLLMDLIIVQHLCKAISTFYILIPIGNRGIVLFLLARTHYG